MRRHGRWGLERRELPGILFEERLPLAARSLYVDKVVSYGAGSFFVETGGRFRGHGLVGVGGEVACVALQELDLLDDEDHDDDLEEAEDGQWVK